MTSSGAPSNLMTIPGLVAEKPYPLLKEKLMLMGRFVGDWEYEADWHLPDGSVNHQKGEMHSAWILNGTAIQEVWIEQMEVPPVGLVRRTWGIDILSYDPPTDAWWNVWLRPLRNLTGPNVGREAGEEVVFTGGTPDGSTHYRWTLFDITPLSFRWRELVSHDGEETWTLACDIAVRRSNSDRHPD